MADQLAGGRVTSRRHPPLWLDENMNREAAVVGSPNGEAIEGSAVVRTVRLLAAGFPPAAERRSTLPPTGRSPATLQPGTRLASATSVGSVQRILNGIPPCGSAGQAPTPGAVPEELLLHVAQVLDARDDRRV